MINTLHFIPNRLEIQDSVVVMSGDLLRFPMGESRQVEAENLAQHDNEANTEEYPGEQRH
jgi:hypothetical protein